MKTIIRSIATANPELYVTQAEAAAIFESRFHLRPEERALYRRILGEGTIAGRHVGMDSLDQATEDDQDRLVERFLKHGRETASRSAAMALAQAGAAASEVGGVVVNTCTGYLCPGLSSYVAEDIGLPADVRPLDIMGMGCGAALPNIQAADNMARAEGGKPVLGIAVEICSATLFMDPDPGVVVSNCIFGDGAAAFVLQRVEEDAGNGLFQLVDFESGLYPQHRDRLQYRTEQHRLRNVLTREVPVIGALAAAEVAGRLLRRHGLNYGDVDHWMVHPGGTQVLDRVAEKLGLEKEALRFSYSVFRQYGNMSSPSVLFVLKRQLEESLPARGARGVMLSFGAGFSAFAALLEF